jgi:RimJ/RimL family protein N-acetyltransferase
MRTSVVLRPLELADVADVFRGVRESRAELGLWMPWCTPDYDQARAAEYVVKSQAERKAGVSFEFGIFGADGEYLGNCGLNNVNPQDKYANLGYWIRTRRTRHGFATSAVVELARWGFANTDLNRFEIVASVENIASQRVAERAGAKREGVARQRIVLGGRVHDAVVYSIVRTATSRRAPPAGP